MTGDKIILKDMRFFGRHGCLPAELELGQWFEVDLEISADLSRAGDTDDLRDTLDYAALYSRIKAVAEGPSYALIEALAARIADICLSFDRADKVIVRLKKPQAPLGGPLAYAAVEIERRRVEA